MIVVKLLHIALNLDVNKPSQNHIPTLMRKKHQTIQGLAGGIWEVSFRVPGLYPAAKISSQLK
jgi:hypothetical protein